MYTLGLLIGHERLQRFSIVRMLVLVLRLGFLSFCFGVRGCGA